MSLRRYVPTGRGGPFAIATVLGVSVVAGVVVGAFEGAIDRWFSLFLLFPLLIGGAAGGGAAWMIKKQRLRAPLLAMMLGAAGGAAGYLAVHTVDYVRFRSDIAGVLSGQNPQASEAEISAEIDKDLVEETGESGVRGFLELAAREGVSIKRMGTGDKGISLTGIGAWIVWLCELLLSAGMAGFIAYGRAKQAFCESCDVWYGPERSLVTGGSGSKDARNQILSALEVGDLDGAARLLVAPLAKATTFAVTTSTCPQCTLDAHCVLKRVTTKRKGPEVSVLDSWLMTKDEVTQLTDAIKRAHARPDPSAMRA
jgi:hypothetical protein